MSSGCGDVLSLEDLKTAKKHQLFEAEVITGRAGGISSGASIDYATNQNTGQVQKTLPAILRDVGFEPASFDFSTGGILSLEDRNKVVYDPVSKAWYSWSGSLPKTIPAGTSPLLDADWVPQTDPNLRNELASSVTPGTSLVKHSNSLTVEQIFDQLYDGSFNLMYRSMTLKDRLDISLTTSAMGATGDGVADDTAAVQSAINTLATMTRKATLFIDGRCKVSTLTIPATLSLSVEGNNIGGSSQNRSALIGSSTTEPVFNCLGTACSFTNIQFVGASNDAAGGGDTTQTAILFNPGVANSYNCDTVVSGCGFVFFNKIFDLRGRNLKVVNCVLSNSAFAVWIGTTGIPDFRGLDMQSCRIHYVSAAAGNEATPSDSCVVYVAPNTNFFSVNITGNYCDGCKWIFVGAAPWGVIANNHINAQQTGVLYHYNTGGTLGSIFHRTSFCNNTITHTNATLPKGATDSLSVTAGWGVDIINNVINNAHRRAINNSVANTRIENNSIVEPGFMTGGFPVIETTGANAVVANNTISRYGTVVHVPSVGIKLGHFTSVEGNRFPVGFGGAITEWDTSTRGSTLIYGAMDIAALPSEEWGTEAPTSGRYLIGSKLWNTAPAASGTLGWVCVASGTPGVWKGFGGIAA